MESLPDWLSRRSDVWQGQYPHAAGGAFIATGYPELDRLLPGSGWPVGSLVELRMSAWGSGEVRLLLPLLRRTGSRGQQVAWLAPPHMPYPPALLREGLDISRMLCIRPRDRRDVLWSMEKLLRCDEVGVVLAWQGVNFAQARRLKLAASEGNSIGFLFRHEKSCQMDALPIPLRLRLSPLQSGVCIDLLKVQSSCGTSVRLNWASPF